MKTTKHFYLAISLIVIASFTSCEKNEEPNLIKIEYGRFWGYIGKGGYDLFNDNHRDIIQTSHFDKESIQFKFEIEDEGESYSVYYKNPKYMTKI